jgi:hypothetical protein
MELRYIRPGRKLDVYIWSLHNPLIILCKLALTQAVQFTCQGVPYDEPEEVLAALAFTERITETARKNGFGNRERMRRSFGKSPQSIQRTVSALVQ